MPRDFLGTGWSYPIDTDRRGDVATTGEDENIAESIRIILGTAKGERVMRPEFGCDIHEHVFDSITPTTLTLLEDAVEEALVDWEPRIDIESVDAVPDDSTANRVMIRIEYFVRNTNSTGNLVYPFYLDEGRG